MNVDKDIEVMEFIIEQGWLISDYEKCTAIDACEEAIKALKFYKALSDIQQEIDKAIDMIPLSFSRENADDCLKRDIKDIFDKHLKEIGMLEVNTVVLNPCPFCGGEASLKVSHHVPTGFDYTPMCNDKSCAGRLSKKWSNINTAIYAWNKRTEIRG